MRRQSSIDGHERKFRDMHVFAYLDPGSGSMVLQMLLGGIASAAVAVKMFGKRIWSTLLFWRKDEETAPPAKPGTPTPTSTPSETEKEPV
jgi:hypothetical protein